MTLHEAIIRVLMGANEPLSSGVIANIINNQRLYLRRDGQPLSSSQISARVSHHPELIKLNEDDKYEIINRALHSLRITYNYLIDQFGRSRFSPAEVRLVAASAVYISWQGLDVNLAKNVVERDDLLHLFNELIVRLNNKESFVVFQGIINQLSAEELWNIYTALVKLPEVQNTTKQAFGIFFNSIVNEYTTSNEIKEGWHSTPPAVANFLVDIYAVRTKSLKIFDPFVGYGSLLASAYKRNINLHPTIVAGDMDPIAIQMAQLNLLAQGCQRNYFYHKNAFNDWGNSILADLILTAPPINVRVPIYGLHNRFRELDDILFDLGIMFTNPKNIDSNLATVIVCLAHLNETGKAAIIVPNGFLQSGRHDAINLKSYLLDHGWLEGVVSLPSNAFRPFHSAQCSVLLINKNTKGRSSIFFCDMSSDSMESFDDNAAVVVKAFSSKDDISELAHWVPYSDVEQSELNLDPKKYLLEPISGDDYFTLSEVAIKLYSGSGFGKDKLNRNEGIPFLQVGDLKETSGLNEIDSHNATYFINDELSLARTPRYIPDRAVLVTKIGTKLKPSLFKQVENTICNPQVIVIKVDEKRILPEYLITQLQSEYVLKQVDAIRKGAGMPHFSQADFQHIKVKVPSLDEQQKFIASFYGKKLGESEAAIERKQDEDLYNIIASIKHELKQPVSSIEMDMKGIRRYITAKIETEGRLRWEEPIAELLPGESIEDAQESLLVNVLSRIDDSIKAAQITLTKAEEILNIGSSVFEAQLIAIKALLEEHVLPQFRNSCCKINITGDEMTVMGDKYSLEILFKRLIENAIKHGFRNRADKAKNVINIRLCGTLTRREFHEIIVENNGEPFSNGFDIDKFQRIGHTSNRRKGTGFGGFQIKRIIETHKGGIHIAEKSEIGESLFKVKFKIYLP